VVLVAALAGFWIRLPYYTISPGGELPVGPRITVHNRRSYPTKGSIFLLYVRERARVNVWRYVQAKLDSEIDIFPEQSFTGGQSPAELNAEAQADMASSQIAAKKVALQTIGYHVPLATRGVVVLATVAGMPAAKQLSKGDVILSVDGHEITDESVLGTTIRKRKPGDTITMVVRRDGKTRTLHVPTRRSSDGHVEIGVFVSQEYKYPVNISIDTSDIGGPSAGLAMTLALIDRLSPGNLTGGNRVAVTGTIATDGTVGEIGGIEQKAVAARAAHATLFIVPKCTDSDATLRAGCEHDLARAKKRAGNLKVVPVATLAQALRALKNVGGDPVERVAAAA
jgi:PDZ domain-containing protein